MASPAVWPVPRRVGRERSCACVGAHATGAIPGGDGTITACYEIKGGAVRVIDADSGATCAADEVKLSWSQRGPAGPAGPKGDKGDTGPQGATSCDAARLLLCPDADLPEGDSLTLSWRTA
jgi:hypothetical protein